MTTRSGRVFACDLAVIGAGAEPEIDFLRDSGMQLEDGIVVNQYLETHLPGTYSAGDIAKFFGPVFRRNRHRTLGQCTQARPPWATSRCPGGALGAFECGAVRALEENGMYADVVAGVSIGAFHAAIVASHPRRAAAALEAFWRELAIYIPAAPNEEARRALSSWYALVFGVPKFFRPRWLIPMLSVQEWSHNWMSFYDASPIKDLLRKYVDFKQLTDSPVRLLVNAVNVETAEIETFDRYIEEIPGWHELAWTRSLRRTKLRGVGSASHEKPVVWPCYLY